MAMTIEQKIKTLMEMHHYIRGDVHFCGYNEENVTQSLETAINIMHKYQKIEKIIDAPIGGGSAKYNAIVNLIKYSEVDNENDD